MKFHPVAEIFPLMQGAEFDALVADMKAHGQQESIRAYNGQILDGRNRWRACQQLKVEAVVEPWLPTNGETPLDFVISKNLFRRHLNDSQRAMVATAISQLLKGEKKADAQGCASQEDAGKMVNVSRRSVQQARKVADAAAPEVAAAVVAGEVSVSDAAAIAEQPKPVQKKAVKAVKAGNAKTLKQAIAEETGDILKDENGQEVPPGLAPVFRGATEFRGILNQLKEIRARGRKLFESPAGRRFGIESFESDLDNVRRRVRFDMPYAICPVCKGLAKERRAKCPCEDTGWLTESNYGRLPSELRA